MLIEFTGTRQHCNRASVEAAKRLQATKSTLSYANIHEGLQWDAGK